MADVEAVIRERITELETERTRLQAALTALKTQGHHRPGKAGKRAKPGQRRTQVLGHLQRNPGARASEVARSIGASLQQVNAVIRTLRADKLVRKRGSGYGTVAGRRVGGQELLIEAPRRRASVKAAVPWLANKSLAQGGFIRLAPAA